MNFARFLRREVLEKLPCRLVWGMDEVDRLFTCSFGTEVFGLLRSWHNARSLDPDASWHKLTVALAYATEAHMFITDMNQSPLNIGTRLSLADFTREEVSELNHRYGCPLPDIATLNQFYELLSGQPYLTRRGLNELAAQKLSFAELTCQASQHDGIRLEVDNARILHFTVLVMVLRVWHALRESVVAYPYNHVLRRHDDGSDLGGWVLGPR
jgi:AAA-like domain